MQRFILVVLFNMGLIIGLGSCVDLVTDEFPKAEPELVVNGLLIAGKNISIHISESDGLDTSFLHPISEASVVLFEDDINVGMLEHGGNGVFSLDEIAKQGRRYRFNILVDGYEPVEVEDEVPLEVDSIGLELINDYGIDYEGVLYPALNLKIPNNPDQDLYFEVLVFLEYPSGTEPAMWQRFEDTLLTREGLPIAVFSNKNVTQDSINIFLPFYTNSSNTTRFTLYPFTVQVRSLSHEIFQFAKKRYLYDLSRYPNVVIGAAPSVNLHSNVRNGLGFVGGMAIYETELIIP